MMAIGAKRTLSRERHAGVVLGLGKMADDALVFGHIDGSPRRPDPGMGTGARGFGVEGEPARLSAYARLGADRLGDGHSDY